MLESTSGHEEKSEAQKAQEELQVLRAHLERIEQAQQEATANALVPLDSNLTYDQNLIAQIDRQLLKATSEPERSQWLKTRAELLKQQEAVRAAEFKRQEEASAAEFKRQEIRREFTFKTGMSAAGMAVGAAFCAAGVYRRNVVDHARNVLVGRGLLQRGARLRVAVFSEEPRSDRWKT